MDLSKAVERGFRTLREKKRDETIALESKCYAYPNILALYPEVCVCVE